MKRIGTAFLAAAVLSLVAMARPETKLEVKGVHICCPMCEKAIGKILGDAGVKGTCSKDTKTVSITADDAAGAQKALDGLAAAGFHGDTGNKLLAIRDDSGTLANPKKPPPKVTSLTIKGVHNCCAGCTKGIKAALAKAEGYESDDLKDKETKVTVKGNFDAAAVIKALNDGGYHGTVDAGK